MPECHSEWLQDEDAIFCSCVSAGPMMTLFRRRIYLSKASSASLPLIKRAAGPLLSLESYDDKWTLTARCINICRYVLLQRRKQFTD